MCTGANSQEPLDLLLAGLAGLASTDVQALTDQQVRDQLLALMRAKNVVDGLLATRVDVFDRRELCDLDAFRTTRSWLTSFGRISQGAATAAISRTRALRALPALQAATLDGRVSAEQIDKVHQLAHRLGGAEQIKACDGILAELSVWAGPAETQKECERILAHLDPDGANPDPEADFERRELTLSRSGSMTYLRGRLDPEGAAAVQTAIDAIMRPPAADDIRDAAQRRADALVDLARGVLALGSLPTNGGTRPQIGLLITPEALTGQASADTNRPAEDPLAGTGVPPEADQPWMSWVGTIPNAVARRLACDAEFFRVVLDPRNGLPLDVGSKHRIVPPWIRRAVLARDRTCRWPGCTAPREWLDIHHVMPWHLYRRTTVEECLALCRYHHVKVDEGGWTITLDPPPATSTSPDPTAGRMNSARHSRGPHRPPADPTHGNRTADRPRAALRPRTAQATRKRTTTRPPRRPRHDDAEDGRAHVSTVDA